MIDLTLFPNEDDIFLQSRLGKLQGFRIVFQTEVTIRQIKGMHCLPPMKGSIPFKHGNIAANLLLSPLRKIACMSGGKALISIDKYALRPIIAYDLLVNHPLVVQPRHTQDPRTPQIHGIVQGVLCHEITE